MSQQTTQAPPFPPPPQTEGERLTRQILELQDLLTQAQRDAARALRERDIMRERVSEPYGCQHCGDAKRHHGRQYLSGVGLHSWERPTDEQVKARMLARRAARQPLETEPPAHGKLWQLLDWSFWGAGMGDVFRMPLADAMVAAVPAETVAQAEQIMAEFIERRKIEKTGVTVWQEQRDEIDRLRAELAEYEPLNPQQCPKGLHADWLVNSEHTHACPWCQIAELRTELAKYVGAEPTIAEEMAYLSRCLHAVHDLCDAAKRDGALGITPEAVEQAANAEWEASIPRAALPWAQVMTDDDLHLFLDDLVSAALNRWRTDANGPVPDRYTLAAVEQACANWRTPGQGHRSDEKAYPPALPWAALMDGGDLAEFLAELEHAIATPGATADEALAAVEKACATWRLIAETQHAHNTAPGPDGETESR